MTKEQLNPARVGVIGCGAISGIYLQQMTQVFRNVEVVACADLDREKAKAQAAEYGVPKVCTVKQMMASKSIDIIVNLTIPNAHYEIAQAAVNAGKSVHNEKPFTITRKDGQALLKAAAKKKVLVGSAPDTFLGAGIQTCRKLIDDGWIGEPVGFSAFMMCHGHESWHPSPEFYYKVGGGPMFDMGPYYLTALVSLLGPVTRVGGSTKMSFAERVITSEPKFGKRVQVEVPTHICGVLDFASGVTGTITTSFDVWSAKHPPIEIYGTEGTLWVPDPNCFGGPVRVLRAGGEVCDVPLSHAYAANSRGIGVADMAAALAAGRVNRCSGELAYHVLDIMHAIHDASDEGAAVSLDSSCERPEAMPMMPAPGSVE